MSAPWRGSDEDGMDRAIEVAASARRRTSPNPWVGAVLVSADGQIFEGATEPPGGRHAEVVALDAAGEAARGSTIYVTLEPCSHHGRTPPCAEAVLRAGVSRVVIGILDPDTKVSGEGMRMLSEAGLVVDLGVRSAEIEDQLEPYLVHRRTGRPLVVLKMACTLDGRIAAPDRTSRWITSEDARRDVHVLRSESDAIAVGAGTVRADDPDLRVRLVPAERQPLRVVLGRAPASARVRPALELGGDPLDILSELGERGVMQLLVEGGAGVAHQLHGARLVDHYVIYVAPTLMGGSDGLSVFEGPGAPTMADAWRAPRVSFRQIGRDLRVDLRR